ncbi:hypothetical protein LV716_01340 [Flagellimonas sp. HMM57]|nr:MULTISPECIES: hypothetical protein [unclassified Flagellimonas]UII76458.1 hypothetical protein LV716_01340 [Flagellimonas sp. HMM57]
MENYIIALLVYTGLWIISTVRTKRLKKREETEYGDIGTVQKDNEPL